MDQITQATGNNLKQQIDGLLHEKDKLKSELQNVQAVLDDYKNRYEDELNRRNHLENDFVVTKKDLDDTYLQKVDKESKMGSLANEIDCLKKLYDEELKELQSQVHNGKVTVEMNNSRDLEMKHIMDGVKAQYQAVADKSRQEADQWYKNKVDDMENQAKRNNEELKALKNDVNELNRMIQRANADNDALKNQRANLESAISLAEEHGEEAARNAKSHIQDLEDAIKKAKQDMARKVKEYQDLMNIKLALDIEIATYRKLLEGEEGRMHDQGITANPVMAVQSMPIEKLASTLNFNVQSSPPVLKSPTPKKLVLVKTIETANGRNFSETTNFSRE
ncbi:hypothetical protein GDO86_020510 [Hymenochirus boettgeri]|uniref:IF rod domain-containing protein n=1 Tax=Hymenochirus boettgeri TaxID=247094 RepID=A0A8T2ILH6_9PIPI|nr:hypothetical protein GDO86_020510 [Hymenochirus boettgeri]